jgi:hypothetical protein
MTELIYNPSTGFGRVEPADPLETVLGRISELNILVHQLRGDRDKWKAAAEVRAKRINELVDEVGAQEQASKPANPSLHPLYAGCIGTKV